METKSAKVVSEEQFFTGDQLIEKAAAQNKLKLAAHRDCDLLVTETLATYKLDEKFLDHLQKNGYEIQHDQLSDGPHTFVIDKGPIKVPAGWSYSHGWGFKHTPDMAFVLSIRFRISKRDRDVMCIANVFGNSAGSAAHEPHERFFNMIVEYDPKTHPFIRRVVEAKHKLAIGWTEIGLGGIRNVGDLFLEFAQRKESIESLARSSESPFDPEALRGSGIFGKPKAEYVPENLQSALFGQWAEQLQRYRDSLARY